MRTFYTIDLYLKSIPRTSHYLHINLREAHTRFGSPHKLPRPVHRGDARATPNQARAREDWRISRHIFGKPKAAAVQPLSEI